MTQLHTQSNPSWLLFCIASYIVIALPTIATAIMIVGRAIILERESHQKRGKELIQKRVQRGLRVMTIQEVIELQYCYRNIGDLNDWMAP